MILKLLIALALWAAFILLVALLQRRHPRESALTAPTAMAAHQLSDTPLTDPTDAATDSANGNSFANSGATFLRFNNTGGSSATVVLSPADATLGPENLAVAGETFTLAASAIQWVGRRDIVTFGRVAVFKTSAATLHASIFEP